MNVYDQILLITIWGLWLVLAAYSARGVYLDLTKNRSR